MKTELKVLYLIAAWLFVGVSIAQTDKTVGNRAANGDYKIQVQPGGSPNDAITVDGATGNSLVNRFLGIGVTPLSPLHILQSENNSNDDGIILDASGSGSFRLYLNGTNLKMVKSGTEAINIDASGITSFPGGITGLGADEDNAGLTTSFFPVIKSSVNIVSSSNYTILDDDGYHSIIVSTGASNRTITLPSPANNTGRILTIIKSDTGAGELIVTGADIIYGQYGTMRLVCDGTNWLIISIQDRITHTTNTGGAGFFTAGSVTVSRSNSSINLTMDNDFTWSGSVTSVQSAVFIPTNWRPTTDVGVWSPAKVSPTERIGYFTAHAGGIIKAEFFDETLTLINSNQGDFNQRGWVISWSI